MQCIIKLKSNQITSVEEITQNMRDIELCVVSKSNKLREMQSSINSQNQNLEVRTKNTM